ncbi:MAG TPA: hypothetical protein PK771_07615, partial [Spirochaetota bacterium]|nr:hypothetical protein [Spirochaetota bacterium]
GSIKISIPDDMERAIVTCSLAGYQVFKLNLKDFDKPVEIKMSTEGFVQGEELVIEESYYTKVDKVGSTKLVDKEELKANAMRGIMEDVMNAVKVLPGVSYSSTFYSMLSIRGSYHDEVSASLDGFIVRYPYFWGGSHSIFNPNIVETVKFSNGTFNAKNGMAISGLLDVETKRPDDGFKLSTNLGMSSIDAYLEIPLINKNMGLLVGGRVTYLEATIANAWRAAGQYVPLAPYIRTGNLKWFWKPNERIEWYVNGFFGADGIGSGAKLETSVSNIKTYQFMQNQNLHAIGSTGLKILPNDKTFIHLVAGYEFLNSESIMNSKDLKKDASSDVFKDLFETNAANTMFTHSVQTKIEMDFQLHEKVVFSAGAGVVYDYLDYKQDGEMYNFVFKGLNNGTPIIGYEKTKFDMKLPSINQFQPYTYLSFSFLPIPDKLEIELGLRVDYSAYTNGNFSLNTIPAFNPRFFISYTPVRNQSWLDYFTISFGTGLYSKMPTYIYDMEKQKLSDFSIKQPQTLTNIIGTEFLFAYGIKLKMEGYYKFYFNRYYQNSRYNLTTNQIDYLSHSDGTGHSAGFDIVIEKKISRYVDGWISYSFNYVRFFNPSTDDVANKSTMNGEPTDMWYYPSHHRFHSMNIVVNIKPLNWLTITPSFGVHSGLPMKEFYGDTSKTDITYNSDTISIYSKNERYNEDLRTGVSLPLGIKLTAHFFVPRTRVKFEFYFAIDNILGMPINDKGKLLWSPDTKKMIDKYTGNIIDTPAAPYETFWPSFGIKISY